MVKPQSVLLLIQDLLHIIGGNYRSSEKKKAASPSCRIAGAGSSVQRYRQGPEDQHLLLFVPESTACLSGLPCPRLFRVRLPLFQVWAHALFYVTGIGITVLLMNLFIGVLGNNFELYQDRSDILFQRARAKILLELQARPWRHISNWVARIVKRLMDYRCGRVGLAVVSGIGLIAFLPVLLALVVFLGILLVLCLLLQMRRQGMRYAMWVALGYGGRDCDECMEECSIFLVLRAEPPMEDLRSLRSEMKSQVQKLESLELSLG